MLIDDLIELGANIIPINLGSLVNSIKDTDRSGYYNEYGAFKDHIRGGWIEFKYKEIEYLMFFIPYNAASDIYWDEVIIVRIAKYDMHKILFNNDMYCRLDSLDLENLAKDHIRVNKKIEQ